MMKKVFKYGLEIGVQAIEMPEGAQILTAQVQQGGIRLWALADHMRPPEGRLLLVIATGFSVPDKSKYISTVQLSGGALIYHIFEGMAAVEGEAEGEAKAA